MSRDPNEKYPRVFINSKVTHENLVEEVLDELFLKRARGEESVEVSSQKFGNKITTVISRRVGFQTCHITTYISSRGEMKMSLRLMICIRRSVHLS